MSQIASSWVVFIVAFIVGAVIRIHLDGEPVWNAAMRLFRNMTEEEKTALTWFIILTIVQGIMIWTAAILGQHYIPMLAH
jgi:hypothetical protein